MKILYKLLFLTLFATNLFGQDNEKIYLIINNGLYGYIDNTGKIIIEPKFISAGRFSEGLAAVRLRGTYGYIDKKGEFVIAPRFDIALSFNNGLAKVFIEGKPYFINKKGKVIFEHHYKSIAEFGSNSFAVVITQTEKHGVINKAGDLIIDTVFSEIGTFSDGVAVVTSLNHDPYSDKSIHEIGLIDTLGNWKVNYGQYKDIGAFRNGYALVRLMLEPQDKRYVQGVIDATGKYRFTIPSEKWSLGGIDCDFQQDIAIVNISFDPDTIDARYPNRPELTIELLLSDPETYDKISSIRHDYSGAINANGEIILYNEGWDNITPFQFNRAFAQDTLRKWFLINTKGEIVTTQLFDEVLYDRNAPENLFWNGIAFVKTKKGWGAIDTTGKFITEQIVFNDSEYGNLRRHKNIVFFKINKKYIEYRYGFWDFVNNTIVKPKFQKIGFRDFDKELIYFEQNDTIGYMNKKCERVWQGTDTNDQKQLNIDYMKMGDYRAASRFRVHSDLWGWASSDNYSKQIDATMNFVPNTFQIVIDTTQQTTWEEKYDAVKMFVANKSADTLYFKAQDSRLSLKIQAQDKNGNWKDIEHLLQSDCGNSYHTLLLPPNEFWEFETPIYKGEFKTKLRAQLLYKQSIKQEKEDIFYSNEIDGYINLGQFWNKKEYRPNGIGDPYRS